MSYTSKSNIPRTVGKRFPVLNALAIEKEFVEIVPQALEDHDQTDKVLAFPLNVSSRTLHNYRNGVTRPGVPEFFVLANHIPALKAKAMEWLGASNAANDSNPIDVAAYLMQAIGSLPQETINAALRKINEEKGK